MDPQRTPRHLALQALSLELWRKSTNCWRCTRARGQTLTREARITAQCRGVGALHYGVAPRQFVPLTVGGVMKMKTGESREIAQQRGLLGIWCVNSRI